MDYPNIILVEDNAHQAAVIIEILEPPTANILTHVISGRKLFEWLAAQDPLPHIEMILLDMRLPGEHGYELLPKIRAYPGLQSVKVLAVTANVLPPDVERAREAGFDGFIGKPIDPDTLPRYVEYAMNGATVWNPL